MLTARPPRPAHREGMDDVERLGETVLYPRSHYAHVLKDELPAATFAPARLRLLRVPLHLALAVVGIVAVAKGWLPWPVVPIVGIAIGLNFACLTFVAHEALHGGDRAQQARCSTSSAGSASCRSWCRRACGWRGTTATTTRTRSCRRIRTPTRRSRGTRRTRARASRSIAFSLGGRRWRGVLSLVLGFTVQSADQLSRAAGDARAPHRGRGDARSRSRCGRPSPSLVGFVPFLFVVRRAAAGRERVRDGVHPDEPQPQPAPHAQRSARRRPQRDDVARRSSG